MIDIDGARSVRRRINPLVDRTGDPQSPVTPRDEDRRHEKYGSDTHSLWQAQYFDGIGRVVQTQAQGETGYTVIASTTTYNNCGQAANQYVSQNLQSSQINGYYSPASGWRSTSYLYDGLGRVVTQTNADGTSVSNDYTTAWQTTVTNERGFLNTYFYDAFGRLTQVENNPPSSGTQEYENYHATQDCTDVGYYAAQTFTPQTTHSITQVKLNLATSAALTGNLTLSIRATDANGHPTGSDLVAAPPLAESSILVNNFQVYTFNLSGSNPTLQAGTKYAIYMTSTQDGVYNTVDTTGTYGGGWYMASNDGVNWNDYITYDIWFEEWGGGSSTPINTYYSYDALNNLIQVKDNNNNLTTMNYDWLSRKTSMTDPDMGSWSYQYDANSNLTSQTDARNQTISFVYDALNRLTNKNYPSGSGMTNVTYTYDDTTNGDYGKGLRTGMTDGSGTTTYRYDARGRQIELTRLVSGLYYTTKYSYDGLDRINQVIYPNPSSTYPTPNGEIVTQTFNGRGMPYSVSGSTAGNLVNSTYYNALGSITEIDLQNTLKSTFGYYGTGGQYDAASDTSGHYYGQLYEIKTLPQSGGTALQDIQYGLWDPNGNLLSRQDVAGGETSESFTYDFLDRLTGVSGPYTQSYGYDTLGDITTMSGTSYTYGDPNHKHAVTAVGSTSYTYDANGNMTSRGNQPLTWDMENRLISAGGTPTEYENYNATQDCTDVGYYAAQTFTPQTSHAVTQVKLDLATSSSLTGTLTVSIRAVDANGHPTGPDLAAASPLSESSILVNNFQVYTFNLGAGCQLQAGTKYAIHMTSTQDGVYNMVDTSGAYGGGWYMSSNDDTNWNDHNQTYDIWFQEWGGTNGSSFVYDGDDNRVEKTDAAGTVVYASKYWEENLNTGVATSNYFLGDRLVAVMQGSTLQYVHQDSLSGTSVTTGSGAAVTGTTKFFPFGATRSGSVPTDEKFTGQRLDGTGLYYYNARYYDPTIGRFISADSMEPDYTNPQSLNRYSYVLNNPLKSTDPTGHQAELDEWMEMQILAATNPPPEQTQQDLLAATGLSQFAPQIPVEQAKPVTTEAPASLLPNPIQLATTLAVPYAQVGAETEGVGWVVGGIALVGYSMYWGVESGWLQRIESMPSIADTLSVHFSQGAQDKKLTKGEIEKLKDAGVDIEDLKEGHAGQRDLYKDKEGNVVVKPKGGNGPGEPTGININDPSTWR